MQINFLGQTLSEEEVLGKIANNVYLVRTLLDEITTLADLSGVAVDVGDLHQSLNRAEYAGGWDASNESDYDESWNSSNC